MMDLICFISYSKRQTTHYLVTARSRIFIDDYIYRTQYMRYMERIRSIARGQYVHKLIIIENRKNKHMRWQQQIDIKPNHILVFIYVFACV